MNARSKKNISILAILLRWLESTFSQKITNKSVRIIYFDRDGISFETSGFTLFRDATLKYKSLKHNGTDLVSSRAETSLSIFLVFVFLIVVKTAFEHIKKQHGQFQV